MATTYQTVPFIDVDVGKLVKKIQVTRQTDPVAVRLKRDKVTCTCYITCPSAIVGNGCFGAKLTQSCGVGRITSGQDVVTREVLFNGIICADKPMILSYDFGFTPDSVEFFALFDDGSDTSIGSTGCVSGVGSFVFVLPESSIGLRVISNFSCLGANVNSSIDAFNILCG